MRLSAGKKNPPLSGIKNILLVASLIRHSSTFISNPQHSHSYSESSLFESRSIGSSVLPYLHKTLTWRDCASRTPPTWQYIIASFAHTHIVSIEDP